MVLRHFGQTGGVDWIMDMMLPLDQAGAQHSQSPMKAEGGTVILTGWHVDYLTERSI
jgi:hypothetical protein